MKYNAPTLGLKLKCIYYKQDTVPVSVHNGYGLFKAISLFVIKQEIFC